MTKSEFIKKAKEIHGNKYDYSKVKYINDNTPVIIICKEHGEFKQKPINHLASNGCRKCCNPRKKTTEQFIEESKKVHGDKYDYSKVKYISTDTKVCIICPIHGEFEQTPYCHLKGQGCPRCSQNVKFTNDDFIAKSRKIHGNKYDYSKVKYVNSITPVCLICPTHGEFYQTPGNHTHPKHPQGCPECAKLARWDGRRPTTEEFIAKAKKVHGDKYDYSKVEYKGTKKEVCIICPKHGEFWQTAGSHLRGNGCPKCSKVHRYSTEEWIKEARKVHGDKYDYSKVEYKGCYENVCIICKEHGEFWQAPLVHIKGHGCPYCNRGLTKQYKFNLLEEFESEYDFRAFLANNDVNILYVILRNIEPKFDPIKKDIEKALANADAIDPIKALEDKYTSDSEDEEDDENANDDKEINNDDEDFEVATAPTVDLDDDDAIDDMTSTDGEEDGETAAPTIEDVIANTEREIKVINKIEHMLTPEDREYIMNKFLNDKRRAWMLKRENRK